MFTRHVQSAIGGGRPLAHDFARVSEGIRASLRAFSSSVRKSEAENGRFYDLPGSLNSDRDLAFCKVVESGPFWTRPPF